jgi:hypothetical protein
MDQKDIITRLLLAKKDGYFSCIHERQCFPPPTVALLQRFLIRRPTPPSASPNLPPLAPDPGQQPIPLTRPIDPPPSPTHTHPKTRHTPPLPPPYPPHHPPSTSHTYTVFIPTPFTAIKSYACAATITRCSPFNFLTPTNSTVLSYTLRSGFVSPNN